MKTYNTMVKVNRQLDLENVLKLTVVMVTQLREYTKSQ